MDGGEIRPGDFKIRCDLSGFVGWASDSVIQWNGLRVLRRFADIRHPQDFPVNITDDPSVRDARPESEPLYLTTPVTPADL